MFMLGKTRARNPRESEFAKKEGKKETPHLEKRGREGCHLRSKGGKVRERKRELPCRRVPEWRGETRLQGKKKPSRYLEKVITVKRRKSGWGCLVGFSKNEQELYAAGEAPGG